MSYLRRKSSAYVRKVSPSLSHQAVEIFRHLGLRDAEEFCVEIGLHPGYARRECHERYGSDSGHRRKRSHVTYPSLRFDNGFRGNGHGVST